MEFEESLRCSWEAARRLEMRNHPLTPVVCILILATMPGMRSPPSQSQTYRERTQKGYACVSPSRVQQMPLAYFWPIPKMCGSVQGQLPGMGKQRSLLFCFFAAFITVLFFAAFIVHWTRWRRRPQCQAGAAAPVPGWRRRPQCQAGAAVPSARLAPPPPVPSRCTRL
eukprot:356274-Chlamydomonas_euryale.AAC.3